MSEEDFFDKFGLSVEKAEPKLNVWYPLYGMITDIIEEREDSLVIEVNFNIKIVVHTDDTERRNLMKERSLESGIFIARFTSMEEPTEGSDKTHFYEAECKTIIFGKPQLKET